MQKRKSHNKSRTGCWNCKKRHVKCDEQGHPCANCLVRGATNTCVYTTSICNSVHQIVPRSNKESRADPFTTITFTVKSRHTLELELMHRWSVCTYKSFCGVADDHHYLQVVLPQCALQYDFLLHGILAASSLDIAMPEIPQDESRSIEYAKMAMEYYGKASVSFRRQLSNVTQDNVHCIYMFSVIAFCINLALTQCTDLSLDKQQSLLDRVPVLFELGLAPKSFIVAYPEWMLNSPVSKSFKTAASLCKEPGPELDTSTEEAIVRLETIIEDATGITEEWELQIYRKSVLGLRSCYVEDKRDLIAGFCIAFPTIAGKEFATEVENLKPIALLILMHWAVSLHRFGIVAWWVRCIGSKLVEETSDTLKAFHPDLTESQLYKDGIYWARNGVGLSNLEPY